MFQFATLCFVTTLVTSLMGFGGVLDTGVELIKGLAVISLVLFCVAGYRGLYKT